jgi:hypothetical protein
MAKHPEPAHPTDKPEYGKIQVEGADINPLTTINLRAKHPEPAQPTDKPEYVKIQVGGADIHPLSTNTELAIIDGRTIRIKRRVSVPTLEFKTDGQAVICQIIEKMVHRAMTIKDDDTGETRPKLDEKGKPAFIWLAMIRAPNGLVRQLVLGEMVMSEITSAYLNDSYIGCWFMIQRIGKKPGKRYVTYEITEIDDPSATSAVDADGVVL